MSEVKQKKGLTAFLASRRGRTLFHVLYSVGAAIVILGALAKIIHLPQSNLLLIIGMVTEAFVFLISAFDVDQVDYVEQSSPAVQGGGGVYIGGQSSVNGNTSSNGGAVIAGGTSNSGGSGFSGNPTIVVGGGSVGGSSSGGSIRHISSTEGGIGENTSTINAEGAEQIASSAAALNEVSQKLLDNYEQLNLSTADATALSSNMKKLNENILKMNQVYESQLHTIETQMNTISHINFSLERIKNLYSNTVTDSDVFRMENEKMKLQIQELNKVYARLLHAMNVGPQGYNNNF